MGKDNKGTRALIEAGRDTIGDLLVGYANRAAQAGLAPLSDQLLEDMQLRCNGRINDRVVISWVECEGQYELPSPNGVLKRLYRYRVERNAGLKPDDAKCRINPKAAYTSYQPIPGGCMYLLDTNPVTQVIRQTVSGKFITTNTVADVHPSEGLGALGLSTEGAIRQSKLLQRRGDAVIAKYFSGDR